MFKFLENEFIYTTQYVMLSLSIRTFFRILELQTHDDFSNFQKPTAKMNFLTAHFPTA